MTKSYGLNELRRMFLDFFAGKGHLVMKSFSLIPHNDKSLLLINAGMAPLKPYFTKQEIPPCTRVATCQKCIRTGDIENIGKTDRHGTFFEMLGNFSFGDYFKHEAIAWSWEFLTEVIGLDPDRLYPSVYTEDDEAFDIWRDEIGIAPERIFRFGKEDNFWEHGAGPCGPCSEIYYDRGEKYGCGKPGCTVGCDCDRYMEIWNNVFTQFDNDGKGNYTLLENKNIDTGMGLERLASVVQDVDSIFDVDTIRALRQRVCDLAHVTYKASEKADVSIRIITDHIRSVTFMVSDGIMPSNEGRGYVLRRLLRRAARHGRLLGISGRFLADLSKTVIETSKDGYPELAEKQNFIFKVIHEEEEKFNKTIDQGLGILADLKADLIASGSKELSGDDAFRLYDTYGFPLDLTEEILADDGIGIDRDGFAAAMDHQRTTARNARKKTNYMGADETVYQSIDPSVTCTFAGYDHTEMDSEILVLTTQDALTEALTDGEQGTILVSETPFYAASGGQECDCGLITGPEGVFEVQETIKLLGGRIGHVGVVRSGMFRVGDRVHLTIDRERRMRTAMNHSATHLLQSALRKVLGDHVQQAGSSNNAERLRFDFTHFSPLSPEELSEVERLVNQAVRDNLKVTTEVMDLEEANKSGAMALFGEKYDQKVRVVSMGTFSKELCGGTHVAETGVIRAFKILSETGVAAGVRRIEALTADGVFAWYADLESTLTAAAAAAKTDIGGLVHKVESMMQEIRALSGENESLKSKLAQASLGDVMDQVQEIKGTRLLAVSVPDTDMQGLMNLGDTLKARLGEGVLVLASSKEGKVSLLAMATEEAQGKGAHAGNLIKGIASHVGGGGGGRPAMAQAGGKKPDGIPAALTAAAEVLGNQLS